VALYAFKAQFFIKYTDNCTSPFLLFSDEYKNYGRSYTKGKNVLD